MKVNNPNRHTLLYKKMKESSLLPARHISYLLKFGDRYSMNGITFDFNKPSLENINKIKETEKQLNFYAWVVGGETIEI